MSQLTAESARQNFADLAKITYPGRGFVMGLNTLGTTALQVYWVMGRSESSRNRRLVQETDIVRTEAIDLSKVTDPSLIIYNAMRRMGRWHIVANGDQTDTVIEGWRQRPSRTFEQSLKTREYEPDAPNYTPRISGLIKPYAEPRSATEGFVESTVAIVRKDSSSDLPIHNFYSRVFTNPDDRGLGWGVHTYLGDGNPLPSYDQEPKSFPLGQEVQDTAEMYWDYLNPDNRVALVVKGIDISTNELSYHIINAREE